MTIYPEVGDKVLVAKIGKEIVVIPKGQFPSIGDTIAVFKLPSGELVTRGKSYAKLNDNVLAYNKGQSRSKSGIIVLAGNKHCMRVCTLPLTEVDSGEEYIFNIPPINENWMNPEETIFAFGLLIVPKDFSRSHGGTAYGLFKVIDEDGNDVTDEAHVYNWEGSIDETYLVNTLQLDKEYNGKLRLVVKENGHGVIGVEGLDDQSHIIGFCSWGSGT